MYKLKRISKLAVLSIVALAVSGCGEKIERRPLNIILMIADGCGFNHIAAAGMYEYGETGQQTYERFPVQLAVSTHPEGGTPYNPEYAWEYFDYVRIGPTDSAAAATAMATGKKSYNGAISVGPDKRRLVTFFEKAEKKGMSSGVVTNVTLSHATPACFTAHNADRGNYEEIAKEMIMGSAVDVIMGCGHPEYNRAGNPAFKSRYKYVGGEEVWRLLQAGTAGCDADGDGQADPWTLIQDYQEFYDLQTGPAQSRILGIPKILETLQQDRIRDANSAPFTVPLNKELPNLTEMTRAALNVLDDNENGFVLMIEGGAVDWASHDNQSGAMIEEQIFFNRAVAAVAAWVEQHSSWQETLVIVTSDHETGYLSGPGSGKIRPAEAQNRKQVWTPLVNNGKENMPGMEWIIGGHTNSLVPFYARGAGCREFLKYADKKDPVRGKYLDNTSIGKVILALLD